MTENKRQTTGKSPGIIIAAIAAPLAVAALGFVLMSRGPSATEVARVAVKSGGDPVVARVDLPAGTRLPIAVYFKSLRFDGQNYLRLHAELLKDSKAVAKVDCRGFYMRGGSGTQNRTTAIRDNCKFRVGASGADSLRISAKPERPTLFKPSGLQIGIRVTPPSAD